MRPPARALLVLALALPAACSDRPKPAPVPTGEAFRINPARWRPADIARAVPAAAAEEAAQ